VSAHLWKIALGVGAGLVVVRLALLGPAADSFVWTLLAPSTLAALALAPRLHRPSDRRPWRVLQAALVLFTLSGLVSTERPLAALDQVFPFGSLLAHLTVLVAFVMFARRQRPGRDRDAEIDTLIVGLSFLAALWVPLHPSIGQNSYGLSESVRFVLVPLLQAALVTGGVSLVFSGGFRVPSAWFLVAWSLLVVGGNLALSFGDSQAVLEWREGLVMSAQVAVTAAALHPSMRRLTEPASETPVALSHARLATLAGALAAGPLGMLWATGALGRLLLPALAAVLATGLVLWRVSRLVRERERARLMQATVARLGQRALEDIEQGVLLHQVCREVATTLGAEHAGVLELAGVSSARSVASWGWADERLGTPIELTPDSSLSRLLTGQTDTVLTDQVPEGASHPLFAALEIRSSAAAVIRGQGLPYGALTVHSRHPRIFAAADLDFVNSVANVVAGAVARRRTEDAIRHRAFHDPLTGLANRELFLQRLAHRLETHRRTRAILAVLFVDLDDFKTVNDSLGHTAGDQLLIAVADRIERCMRPGDTAARMGGDEFAILLEHLDSEEAATAVAERLQAALADPLAVGDLAVPISASIGITWSDATDVTAGDLLRDADAAMYTAKAGGKGTHELFRPAMHTQAVRRLELKADLDRALREGQFFLAFQPIVDLPAQRTVGAEALLRWQHPERGLVPPDDFIPLAEESGIIVPLGRWVLAEACRHAAGWSSAHPDLALTISVNLSARQLASPRIVDDVSAALDAAGLPPERLILELTESMLLSPSGTPPLRQLKALGVRLAIDDFGTGYSSLGQLRNLRPDVLKIDKSFVDELGRPGGDTGLAHGIMRLARTLDVVTVAEGVEQEAQLHELEALHCDLAQGYHFARPLAPEVFAEFLREHAAGFATPAPGR
jgi:diguanylate cyclase (GGDEF)-like protein